MGVNPVELAGATLGRGERRVLHDVSLAIRPGEFVGVLGPNGAGKTTLFRALLGLLRPESGTVRVFGAPARPGHPHVGYMPQARAAPAMCVTGRDVVASAAGGVGWGLAWPGRAAQRDVDRVLDLVDGAALARRPLSELSGGERQRLLLAQALLGQPRLLLLDEPLLSLDPRRQAGAVSLVRRLQGELGLTVLFSAHELNPLLPAMDRVVYLGAGRAAVGQVGEVVTGPVLSQLYGAPMEVMRVGGRIFVVGDGVEAGRETHQHEQHQHEGGHGRGTRSLEASRVHL